MSTWLGCCHYALGGTSEVPGPLDMRAALPTCSIQAWLDTLRSRRQILLMRQQFCAYLTRQKHTLSLSQSSLMVPKCRFMKSGLVFHLKKL